MDRPDQLQQMPFPVKIDPVGTQVDPRQYDFFIVAFRQFPHLAQDILHHAAAHPAAGIRDNAVSAELVASVLDLDIGSRVIARLRQMQGFIFAGAADVFDLRGRSALCRVFVQDPHQVFFMIVSEHNVNARILAFPVLRLDVAARCHDDGVRVHLPRPVQHLPGLPVGDIRHCTGIDNIDVRPFFKRHDLVSCLLEHFLHCFCFICVYFAPQIVQSCFLTHQIYLIFPLLFLDF